MGLPGSKTLHRMFEGQARATPDRVALVYRQTRMTFGELNQRANAIALGLRARGIETSSVVALLSDRSLDMVAAILGILKAGAAYLPIDPTHPVRRIEYMLSNSGASLLLTNFADRQRIEPLPTMIPIANVGSDFTPAHPDNPANLNTCDALLYVIYTSGTTGMPKGVMLHHGALINLVEYEYACTNIDFTKVLQFAPISFDVASQEIFSTLLFGGTLYLIDEEIRRDIWRLFALIERHHIRTFFVPAALLNALSRTHAHLLPRCLSHIVSAGEQLIVSPQLRAYLRDNGVYLHNHYGPSETHVVTALTLEPSQEIPTRPSIGRPVSNVTIYILDDREQLVDDGELGELCIGGAQVGMGYISNHELTDDRFIADPFTGEKRIYKTGDIARWLPDGTIEFVGRADSQVKVAGHRIQLEEIENRLLEHTGVESAAVIVLQRSSSSRCLCAYYTASISVPREALREFLSMTLPDYMLPSYYVRLESLPLTINGKVDKSRLPDPSPGTSSHDEKCKEPIRMELLCIFAEVLGTGRVGLHDTFTEMELDSLDIMLLNLLMNDSFSLDLSFDEMMRHPSIDDLANFVAQKIADGQASLCVHGVPKQREAKTTAVSLFPENNAADSAVEPVSSEGKDHVWRTVERRMSRMVHQIIQSSPVHVFPAPALQQYYLESDLINQHIVPELIEIHGLDGHTRLRDSLQRLIQNHDILRTSLRRGNEPLGHLFVEHAFPKSVQIPFLDLSHLGPGEQTAIVEHIIRMANQPFDLFSGLFYRVVGVRSKADRNFLLCFSSHFMVDGFTSFKRAYSGLGEEVSLQGSNSYLAYLAERQDEFSGLTDEQKEAYLRHFKEYWSVTSDFHARFLGKHAEGTRTVTFEFPYELRGLSLAEFCTTVVCRTLARVLAEENLPVRLFYHGRDYGKLRFYDLMGDLHDNYFLHVLVSAEHEPTQTLAMIRSQMLEIGYGKINMNNLLVRLVQENPRYLDQLGDQSTAITINIDPMSSQVSDEQMDRADLSCRISSLMREHKKSSVRGISVRICPDVRRKKTMASLKHVDYLQHMMLDIRTVIDEETERLLNSLPD